MIIKMSRIRTLTKPARLADHLIPEPTSYRTLIVEHTKGDRTHHHWHTMLTYLEPAADTANRKTRRKRRHDGRRA